MLFKEELKASLSTPISDELPCGDYLKADRSRYRPLRNQFNVAQTSLRKLAQNPDETELESLVEENISNWNALSSSLIDVFKTESRDIELIGWMLAAQFVLDETGAGAANVTAWLEQLVEESWDVLNPHLADSSLDVDGEEAKKKQYETKIKAFFQICGDSEDSCLIYGPLLMFPIIGDVTFFRYQSAERKGETNKLKSEIAPYIQQSKPQVQILVEHLDAMRQSCLSISAKVNGYSNPLGLQGINFTFVLSLLGKLLNAIQFLTGIQPSQPAEEMPIPPVSESNEDGNLSNHPVLPTTTHTIQTSQVATALFADVAASANMNRDAAFKQLREIADYFRTSEPHSPVSFLLEKAIRWGYMPLPELMSELMTDSNTDQSRLFNLAGLDSDSQVPLPATKTVLAVQQPASTPPVSESREPAKAAPESSGTPQSNEGSTGSTGLRW
ncbi:type VI secretion system ImpA family N-terminal domain-containing protein [Enterovibrio sp. ZSDZ35]|uniref:Type VI secretion system ImpA family N-terminal domain-containing protein n=1 Tax=Enterovibrio qingdaonensis TaxID=2899818 RepID=A0ABT5QSM6_9GAMM|nr:type VI secretion system ImpA family N-terminal domain-containing protein [Enterovibrio sp. ZSDZ35]MDD1783983.1 type VI secretion system ImpA family N-terminal domain-containing protein [Enterovibrio sp. ZSDZ35]